MKEMGRNRNDPCSCGSGKKYKHCCMGKEKNAGNAPETKAATNSQTGKVSIATQIQIALEHHQAGRLSEAEALYQQVLQRAPNDADALHLLGYLYFQQGRLESAADLIGKAIKAVPRVEHYHFNLGTVLQAAGKWNEAAACYRQAIAIKPRYVEAHSNLGNVLNELGRQDEAIASCKRALSLKPDCFEAHSNLGNALQSQGRLNEAIASHRQALLLKPDCAEVYCNLGGALFAQGKSDEAIANFRQALILKPDYAEAYSNLGNVFFAQGLLDEAIACCQQALSIKPDFVGAYSNLGGAFLRKFRLDEAIACYRQALLVKPDSAETYSNLGNTLQIQGKLNEAIASYRQALLIKPDFVDAHSNLLFNLNYHPDKNGEEIFAEYREYDAHFCAQYRSTWQPHGNDRDVQRRLKIGYVSPDFRLHPVRHFLEPVLAHHDKQQVEIYAYAELMREDEVTTRYKGYVDHWIPTVGQSDEALAERIRTDGIDILVDLAGHTERNRLQVFARKPAPVSVTWLGYGYTTGLAAIDYILADPVFMPPGCEGLFSETPWRIETPSYVYRPAEGMGEAGPLPALLCGHVTFGTLTRSVRINHRTVRVWSAILRQVPGATLMLDSGSFQDEGVQSMLEAQFAEHGISRERLVMGCHTPPWDVLREMDIGLDCFPHNSGTTLFETLYLGVPFVTLAGRPSVGCLGSSILEGAGHPEWIARTEDDYIAKAVELASDLSALSGIRNRLRREMEAGRLMDEAGCTRKVEAAYRAMFAAWSETHQ